MKLLTQDEIFEITKKRRWNAQIRALRNMGIEVTIRPDGSPMVNAQHFEIVTGGVPNTSNKQYPVKLNLSDL